MAAAVACTSAAAAACEDAAVEATMLSALRRRNTNLRPSCVLSRACEDLLNRHAALQADLLKQQQRADGLLKEKVEMQADLKLLRENEANSGVTREHIELLQQQLEIAKSEAARASREAAEATGHAQAAREASHQLGDKVSLLTEQLANSRAERDEFKSALEAQMKKAADLERDNTRLVQRLMEQMHLQAQVMNTEIAEHEERRASQTSVALVDASAPSAEAPADAPAEQSDLQRALAESEALSCVAPATAETPSH